MRARLLLSVALIYAAAVPASAQLANNVNYNADTPAPPVGARNVHWQTDHGRPTVNASAYVIFPTVQVACPTSGDLSIPVETAMAALPAGRGGIVDARACTAVTTWTDRVFISNPGTTILLPCATITAAWPVIVSPGIRNVSIKGCSLRGGSTADGTVGGTVWIYTGSSTAFLVGDPSYAVSTKGFSASDLNINVSIPGVGSEAFYFANTQEIRLDNLYLNGNGVAGQSAIILDGTSNYSGGTFIDIEIAQFGTAWKLTGHLSGSVQDDYANASTFIRTHIVCPTSGGHPIPNTFGIDVQGGDGNTWSGGDVESCETMFRFGPHATANTVIGLRNENSTYQYVAQSGSSYNMVKTGGTLFTNQLLDVGSFNSFEDAFHHTVNGVSGNWTRSQVDATLTDHIRVGIGLGNERGYQTEIQTDYGYRWMHGLSDGTTGEQFYSISDIVNNVQRLNFGQWIATSNHTVTNVLVNNGGCYSSSTPPTLTIANEGGYTATGTPVMGVSSCSGGWQVLSVTMTFNGSNYITQPGLTWAGSNQVTAPSAVAEINTLGSWNNETDLSSAGIGAINLNLNTNSGSGGVVFGSGGVSPTAVGNIDQYGNLTQNGYHRFYASGAETWRFNCANAGSCNLQSMTGGVAQAHIRMYNGSGTDILSEGTYPVTIGNTSGSGTGGLIVYAGGSTPSTQLFGVLPNGSGGAYYHMPTIAAATGHNCLQVDNSGYVTNTGAACSSASSGATVASVGLSLPADFTVSNSPVTTTGTLTAVWAVQAANLIHAGPSTGSAAAPTWRALAAADIPTPLTSSTSGNAATATALASTPSQCSAGQYSTGVTAAGTANCATVQYSNLGGSVPTWNQSTSGNANTATTTTGNAATATALAATPSQCPAGQYATGVTASGTANCAVFLQTITFSTSGSSLPTTGTTYMGVGYAGGNQHKGGFIAQRAATVQGCSAAVAAAVTGSLYYTATLFKNGSACTSGPVIVVNGGSFVVTTDDVHTCTVARGDQLTWQFTATGTIPSADVGWASCQY
jgi:hypothetical protein